MHIRSFLAFNGKSLLRTTLRRYLRAELLERRELLSVDMGASAIGFIPKEPDDLLQSDRLHYSEMFSSSGSGPQSIIPLGDTFFLHSRPSASKTAYLDFDGFVATGTPWNSSRGRDPIVSPAWDPDGNGPEFTDAELMRIQGIWKRVAADFASFDVNVTTQDPGEADLVRTGPNDTRWGIRVVFTGDDFPLPGTGGGAYIGSFNWGYNSEGATDTPSYVFNLGEVTAAGAASHEIGHALGLSHDGTTSEHPTQPNQEYYAGHGFGENGWGPIMGVGGYYQNVTTWDNGIYFASSNGGQFANYGSGPDDLLIITSNNGFGYLPDNEPDTISTAAQIESFVDFDIGLVRISQFGVINDNQDVDVFRFQVGAGLVNLTFDPYVIETFINSGESFERSIEDTFLSTNWSSNQGSNLDIRATLYDSGGNVVAVSDPEGLRASFTDLQLSSGVYYVALEGVGFGNPTANPPTGYTDYASIGQYLITGTVPVALGIILPGSPVIYTEGDSPIQVTNSATVVDAIAGDYSDGSLEVSIAPAPGSTDRLHFDPTLTGLTNFGGVIQDAGLGIATITSVSETRINFRLNANTSTAAIEKLVMSIRFEATGDGPDSTPRGVLFRLDKGAFSVSDERPIEIIQVNDAPTLLDSMLTPIAEDSLPSIGQTIGSIFQGKFIDPDPGSSLQGIAVVNSTTPASEGRWQILLSPNGTWSDLPALGPSDRLALSVSTRIRFVPAQDFFGYVTPLQVFAIDDSYTGTFSTASNMAFLPPGLQGPESPVSLLPAALGILVTPVNDPPIANLEELRFSVYQDQPLLGQIPDDAVIDVDDTVFTYSATRADGRPLPAWLRVNSPMARFEGTPGMFDVGMHELILSVADPSGAMATLPVFIYVIDVNDAPIDLRFVGSPIPENFVGFQVGKLFAYDPEGDSIIWTSSDPRFTVQGNEVILNSLLDYEIEQFIEVTFRASDDQVPPLSAELLVVLSVVDVNEFYPDLRGKTFAVTNGTPAGTLLERLEAPDGDIFQTVRFVMRDGDVDAFLLDQNTGDLFLAIDADQRFGTEYTVFVEAYDNGTPRFATTAQFVLQILPVNQFPPVIDPDQQLVFEENLPAGTEIGRITASDLDGTPLRFELLEVVGGTLNWVNIHPVTGVVRLTAAHQFDFESDLEHALRIRVVETVEPFRFAEAEIPITLLDVNDPPSGLEPVSIFTSRSGASADDFVVLDQDVSDAGYAFSTTDPRFEIRDGKLALRPQNFFDASMAGTATSAVVRVTDNSDPASFADLSVTVQIVFSSAWQNPIDRLDVNRDGRVSSLDALLIINELNREESRQLDNPRRFEQLSLPDYDTSGDNRITALDSLLVINYLNSRTNAEGESAIAIQDERRSVGEEQAWLMAFEDLEEGLRRGRGILRR